MKKIIINIFLIFFFTAFSYSLEQIKFGNGIVEVNTELIDLGKEKISLSGKWRIYKNVKFESNEYLQAKPEYKSFSYKFIEKIKESLKHEKQKTAIYCLKIEGLKPNYQYAIFSRQSPTTAANFYCNDKLKASYGICSDNPREHKSEIEPVFLYLNSDRSGQIDLKIEISSFENYKAEMVMPILFAERSLIITHVRTIVAIDVFLISAFLFCGIFNFVIFLKHKKRKEKLTISVLFALMSFHLILSDGSLFILNMPGISYDIILWAQNIFLWLFPVMFTYIFFMDREFVKRYPIFDKAFIGMFSVLGFIFLVQVFAKVNIKHFRFLALFLNLIFYMYAIFRVSYAASKKQKDFVINVMFYIWIYTAVFIDFVFIDVFAKQVVLYTEVAFLVLILFDVVYMAYSQQRFFIKARKSLADLQNTLIESKKFISPSFTRVIQKQPEEIKVGDYRKVKMTIMYIHLKIVNLEGETTNVKQSFEIYNEYLKMISNVLFDEEKKEEGKNQKNTKGFVAKYLRDGCVLFFEENPNDALECAKKIMKGFKEYNKDVSDLKRAWVIYSAGIHTEDIVVCSLGESERIGAGIVGKGIAEVQQIVDVSMNKGRPFLVSEQTVLAIQDEPKCTIERCDDLVVYSDNSRIQLYECKLDDR